jgi:C4-dicarboxylate-specific signal transduction histidine kinase
VISSVQLQQVILNLMLNAFSAMSGTRLDGARRLIVRTNAIDTSNVLVEVQDSGTGIAAEKTWAANNPDRGAKFSITLPVTCE